MVHTASQTPINNMHKSSSLILTYTSKDSLDSATNTDLWANYSDEHITCSCIPAHHLSCYILLFLLLHACTHTCTPLACSSLISLLSVLPITSSLSVSTPSLWTCQSQNFLSTFHSSFASYTSSFFALLTMRVSLTFPTMFIFSRSHPWSFLHICLFAIHQGQYHYTFKNSAGCIHLSLTPN